MTMSEAIWQQIRAGREPSAAAIDELAAADPRSIGQASGAAVRNDLAVEVLGLGPLSTLAQDPSVTDILVNGTTGVWIDRGRGVEAAAVDVGEAETVRRLAVRLATMCGRRLDDSSPCVDGLLPGGIRLHAVLPPLVEEAAHLSLRIPARTSFSLAGLVEQGTLAAGDAALLRQLIAARIAFVVSGGTGSGKTTLLGALLRCSDPADRLLVIEDVRELHVVHPHVVRLEARAPNIEGAGAVPMATLVRQALRMRPDRIVVGEVRGAEVRDLLAALNTGHEGGCGTIHANSPGDVPARFEALGALADMSPEAVRTQFTSAIDVVLHVRRQGGERVLDEIGLVHREAGGVRVVPALERRSGQLRPAAAYAQFVRRLERSGPRADGPMGPREQDGPGARCDQDGGAR